MGRKTPPCELYPKWTEARFKSFLKSALRQASQRWPPSLDILKSKRRPYTGKDKRTKWEYPCNHCFGWFKAKEIRKDHIKPVGGFSPEFKDWPKDFARIAERMFCGESGYQLLCKKCHCTLTNKQKLNGDLYYKPPKESE